MIGARLRQRLNCGETITMVNPHHTSFGLSQRLVEAGADTVFVDCEHGTWGFEDVRNVSQAVRSVGGGAIVRPHSHERPLLIRYLNAGADGLMVPMVNTAEQGRAIVEAVQYALPASYDDRLVVCMIETVEAIAVLDELLAVDGIDVFFVGPSDLSQSMGFPPALARGQQRPAEVRSAMEHVFRSVRASGKIAGTLVNDDDIGHWTSTGVQYLYIHSDPFLADGLSKMKSLIADGRKAE